MQPPETSSLAICCSGPADQLHGKMAQQGLVCWCGDHPVTTGPAASIEPSSAQSVQESCSPAPMALLLAKHPTLCNARTRSRTLSSCRPSLLVHAVSGTESKPQTQQISISSTESATESELDEPGAHFEATRIFDSAHVDQVLHKGLLHASLVGVDDEHNHTSMHHLHIETVHTTLHCTGSSSTRFLHARSGHPTWQHIFPLASS